MGITSIQFPMAIIYKNDEYMIIFLIVILAISLLLSDKKYAYVTDTLNLSSDIIMLIFMAIIIFRIVSIILNKV